MYNNDIIKADPVLRRILLIIILAVLISGVYFSIKMQKLKTELVVTMESDPELVFEKLLTYMKAFIVANLLIIGMLSIYIFVLAVKTIRSRQFPPPGVGVIRDTIIQKGKNALRTGYLIIVLGLFLIIFTIILNYHLNRIVNTIIIN